MSFPWDFESNFEQGTNAEWTSETDTGSLLDFPHASALAGVNPTLMGNMAPFRGAYVMRVSMSGTADAMLTSTAIDIANEATSWFRWYMFFGKDVAATAADVVNIFKLQQAGGGTVEETVGLNFDGSGGIFLGGSDGTTAANFGTTNITLGVWHCIEVQAKVSTTGAGVVATYLDGVQQTSQTTLTQAAATGDGVLGIMNRLATTTGTILFDQFVQDSARIYPIVDRYPQVVELTKSGHVFVGPGTIENIELVSGGTDNIVQIYDTNRANTNDFLKVGHELRTPTLADTVESYGIPIMVKRGCYVALTGTAPRAFVKLSWAPAWGSPAAVRNVAGRLRTNPLEVF